MIEIYGTSACQYCKDAQLLCVARNKDFKYNQVDVDIEALDELEERLGKRVRQVPQIFMDGAYVGGYTELKEKLNVTDTGAS